MGPDHPSAGSVLWQIAGAVLKTFVLFRMDRQKWTRQGSSGGAAPSAAVRISAIESTAHHILALGWLTLAVAYMTVI